MYKIKAPKMNVSERRDKNKPKIFTLHHISLNEKRHKEIYSLYTFNKIENFVCSNVLTSETSGPK